MYISNVMLIVTNTINNWGPRSRLGPHRCRDEPSCSWSRLRPLAVDIQLVPAAREHSKWSVQWHLHLNLHRCVRA